MGNLGVLAGFGAADAHRTNHLSITKNGHAALEHALEYWSAQK